MTDTSNVEHSEVTSVIRHNVKEADRPAYETWLREIVPLSASFPGHRGVNVIRPTAESNEYTVVLHFDTIDSLRNWLDSEQRKRLIEKARPFLGEDNIEIKTGLEFWFTPPSAKQPRARPYKQFLVTLSAIYPLGLIVPFLFKPVFERFWFFESLYLRSFIVTATIVALIIYVVMPRYTRLIAKWLYK